MGDSISAAYGMEKDKGWVALLRQKLHQDGTHCSIANSSISGDTSAAGLARIDRALDQYKPQIVIIELGGNDGLRGFPPTSLKANLKAMIDRSKTAGGTGPVARHPRPTQLRKALRAAVSQRVHSTGAGREYSISSLPARGYWRRHQSYAIRRHPSQSKRPTNHDGSGLEPAGAAA